MKRCWWVDDAVAASTYTNNSPTLPFPEDSEAYMPANHNNTVTNQMVVIDSATCNHASGIVNGHYSSIPSVNLSNTTIDLTTTHASHSSHGSGWWC